jgi:beta-lactamase class A
MMDAYAIELRAAAGDCPGTLAIAVHGHLGLNEYAELPLAGVGKLLLLAETAMRIAAGMLDPREVVELEPDDYTGGSGLLGGLAARRWTVRDLALLTAAVSDNTATNALLRRIGPAGVNAGAAPRGADRLRR